MNCRNHSDIEATQICLSCGKPLCGQCTIDIKGRAYCTDCIEAFINIASENKKVHKKNKILTFFLGFIPGLSHMYLGMINKGLAIMVLLFVSLFSAIFFSDSSTLYWFPGFFIPTFSLLFVSYSIFDSLSIVDRINSGELKYDESWYELTAIRQKIAASRKIIGFIMISMGLIILFNIIIKPLETVIIDKLGINVSLTSLLVALVLVILGILFIRRGKKSRGD
ncbi:MAG: hypothetical protein Q8920_14095 [Bacillota bacterium]|nr:hypothetical protein [Bacillota bacterium]